MIYTINTKLKPWKIVLFAHNAMLNSRRDTEEHTRAEEKKKTIQPVLNFSITK